MAAPHHLSGPPPPATAVPDIGVTGAPKVSIPAASSAIASNAFIFPLLECRLLTVRENGRETALPFGRNGDQHGAEMAPAQAMWMSLGGGVRVRSSAEESCQPGLEARLDRLACRAAI
jgi:hypothetical protein